MRNNPYIFFILLFITLIFYILIGQSGDFRSTIETYWIFLLPIYISYGYFVLAILKNSLTKKISFSLFIISGILFRLVLIPSEPVLSDDVYRYLWDGRVTAAGINPYSHTPVDQTLDEFQDEDVFPNINFPEIATVYPPVSQLFFLINQIFGGTLFSWKILLLVVEMTFVVLIIKILNLFSLNKFRLLILFYNPLLIIETYHSGHLEIIGLLLFWLAIYAFYRKLNWLSVLFISMAIMTKFIPLISAIPLMINNLFKKVLLLFSLIILILLPFCFGNSIPLPGLFSYLNRWEFNGAIYQLVVSIFKKIEITEYKWITASFSGHLETFYFNAAFYYKVIAVFILLVVIWDQIKKLKAYTRFQNINFIQRSFVLTAFFLLLTPTLHPWYLLWIIPFLVFIPNWSWISFTFMIQLSYFVLKEYSISGVWEESTLILLLQYLPFFTLLIIEYKDKSKIKGWFIR